MIENDYAPGRLINGSVPGYALKKVSIFGDDKRFSKSRYVREIFCRRRRFAQCYRFWTLHPFMVVKMRLKLMFTLADFRTLKIKRIESTTKISLFS